MEEKIDLNNNNVHEVCSTRFLKCIFLMCENRSKEFNQHLVCLLCSLVFSSPYFLAYFSPFQALLFGGGGGRGEGRGREEERRFNFRECWGCNITCQDNLNNVPYSKLFCTIIWNGNVHLISGILVTNVGEMEVESHFWRGHMREYEEEEKRRRWKNRNLRAPPSFLQNGPIYSQEESSCKK